MEPHIKTWRVHRALSWFFALLSTLCLFVPLTLLMSEEGADAPVIAASFALPGYLFLLALFHHVVARGAKARRRWARIASLCIAVLMVFAFPVGTLIGFYLATNNKWTEAGVDAPVPVPAA